MASQESIDECRSSESYYNIHTGTVPSRLARKRKETKKIESTNKAKPSAIELQQKRKSEIEKKGVIEKDCENRVRLDRDR